MKLLEFVMILFLSLTLPLVYIHELQQDLQYNQLKTHRYYADAFQTAVDDTGAYLARLEAQQWNGSVRYGAEKQLTFDENALSTFWKNLALQFNIEGDPVALQNLMIHTPAMVLIRYNGYVLITLDDQINTAGNHKLSPVFWPIRPYIYTLPNGNIVYFTLDDQATVYSPATNSFYNGDQRDLVLQTNMDLLANLQTFREVRQTTITATIEKDLAGAINNHMGLVKRMDLNIQFSLPRGLNEQSIQNMGFMAFVQGYPLPGGELLDMYSFGGGFVVKRDSLVGTIQGTGKKVAYGSQCVPSSGATSVENFFNAKEAVLKGYFIAECP